MLNKSGSLLGQKAGSAAQGLSEADLARFCSEIFPDEPMYQRMVNEARFGLARVLPILSSLGRGHPEVLEDYANDPTRAELAGFIDALNDVEERLRSGREPCWHELVALEHGAKGVSPS